MPSVSASYFSDFGAPNAAVRFCLVNTDSGTSSFVTQSFLESVSSVPPSQTISKRLVPGTSPVEVMNVPVAPFLYSQNTLTSSSTSISCHLPKYILASSFAGIPHIHCHRSS